MTRQTVVFADGRVRVRNVQCLGEKDGARVGEAWIGDRMARVTEVEFGAWREKEAEGVSSISPAAAGRRSPRGRPRDPHCGLR